MTSELTGRRLLVTGAARGIGRATVECFLREGAAVAAIDSDEFELKKMLRELSSDKLFGFTVDVVDSFAVSSIIISAANALGGIDGLVNGAGIDLVADLENMALSDWSRVIAVNLTGPMLVVQAAYPFLKAAGGGTIVNVSSGAGLSPLKHRSAYCASKAGLQMMSKALAIEAATFGIRVNCVCPGAVETELFRSSLKDASDAIAAREEIRARYALNRIAEPHEIAAAILWLTGSASSYVTGTAIAVDGGRTFH